MGNTEDVCLQNKNMVLSRSVSTNRYMGIYNVKGACFQKNTYNYFVNLNRYRKGVIMLIFLVFADHRMKKGEKTCSFYMMN